MPSKAALEAFNKLKSNEEKAENLLPPGEVQRLLKLAENRVNKIASKSTIFDEEAEKTLLKFSHDGKSLYHFCHYFCYLFP